MAWGWNSLPLRRRLCQHPPRLERFHVVSRFGIVRDVYKCLPRCRRGLDASFARGCAASDRSEERFAGESNTCNGAIQAGPTGAKGTVPDGQAQHCKSRRFRQRVLPRRPRTHVGVSRRSSFDQIARVFLQFGQAGDTCVLHESYQAPRSA